MKVNKLSSSKCRVIYRKTQVMYIHICVYKKKKKTLLRLQKTHHIYGLFNRQDDEMYKTAEVTHNRDEGEKHR